MRTASGATLCFACLIWLDASLAALQTGDRDSKTGRGSIGLCQASPEQRREYAIARYEDESPAPGIEAFLTEWHRDLNPEETRRYQPLRMLGSGKQGSVLVAKDLAAEKLVAIKQVKNAFGERAVNGHRTLRELTLLRLMNVSDFTIDILHAFLPNPEYIDSYTTVYFVMELMDMPLVNQDDGSSAVMELSPEKQQTMMFHALNALADMHSVGVFHRDLTLGNIMGNVDCTFKVIDLGMSGPAMPAFVHEEEADRRFSHRYGITKYRPPELYFRSGTKWKSSYDVWMLGCTFLRLLVGRPSICVPPPNNYENSQDQHIKKTIAILGMPSEYTLDKYHDEAQPLFRSNRPNSSFTPTGLAAEHPEADKELLELVQRMLDLDPDSRPTVNQLLQDPVFAGLARSTTAFQRQFTSGAFFKSLDAINSRKAFEDVNHNRMMVYQEIKSHYSHGFEDTKSAGPQR